jgi:hypothetical protein
MLGDTDIPAKTVRKVRNRLIPLLLLLYIIAFLDRTNIGFAALTMECRPRNNERSIRAAQRRFLLALLLVRNPQ